MIDQADNHHPSDGPPRELGRGLLTRGQAEPAAAPTATVAETGIRVSPVRVNVSGLSGLPVSAYSSQLRIVVPLSTLPLHMHLTSVHVTPDGLRIAASARHVQFARG